MRLFVSLPLLLAACSAPEFDRPHPNQGMWDPHGGLNEGFFTRPVNLTLQFPTVAVGDNTEQVLLILRVKPASGDGCDALWQADVSGLKEAITLIAFPNSPEDKVVLDASGNYDAFVYAFGTAWDQLCQTDDWCEDSELGSRCAPAAGGASICSNPPNREPTVLAGGCTGATLDLDTTSVFTVVLELPP